MRVAFVGVKRKYKELSPEYRDFFNQFHIEVPYYYARDGQNSVILTTIDYDDVENNRPSGVEFDGGGQLIMWPEENFRQTSGDADLDVVVHWRKWHEDLYCPGAINVINCQDHSFSQEWLATTRKAFVEKKLYGILCFPTWHKRNTHRETGIPLDRLLDGVTLGVDTDIYKPVATKDRYQMLWASDPGRGLQGAIMLAIRLWQVDKRFRLHVCHPDYAQNVQRVNHPAIEWRGNVPNGPELWKLFNETGVLPYTSTFVEPSSRAHRQAQSAGSLVFYPPNMGTPSETIQQAVTGVVTDPASWLELIVQTVASGEYDRVSTAARQFALSENWAVQAHRFNKLFERILGERK